MKRTTIAALRPLMASLLLAIVATSAQAALPIDACTPPSYYPIGPSIYATDAVTFVAYDRNTTEFVVQFWREPCYNSDTRSLLFARFVCGTHDNGFAMQQAGATGVVEYTVLFNGGCSSTTQTRTFLIEQPALATMFRNSGSVTLLHRGAVLSSGALPSYRKDIKPVVGLWWNPKEPGSGYSIDVKNGTLVLTTFSYTASGDAQWYLSYGPLKDNSFTGKLEKYFGGQCISCPYTGEPQYVGDDGDVTIKFTSPTSATLTLPGGRVTAIEPQPF